MTTKVPCFLASEEWTTVPFLVHPKTVNDKLIDILLRIPAYIATKAELLSKYYVEPYQNASGRLAEWANWEKGAGRLIYQLEEWWSEFNAQCLDENLCAASEKQYSWSQGSADDPSTGIKGHRSGLSAAFTATYHAGNIILLSILSRPEAIDPHVIGIMSVAQLLLNLGDSPSEATLMMVFPLRVASNYACLETQKSLAGELLGKWGSSKGVDGIATVAGKMR
jgi:hypothetical protein